MKTWPAPLFLGLDSSTQSLTAVLLDAETGEVRAEYSVEYGRDLPEYHCPHGFLDNPDPLVRHADPLMWVAALDLLFARMRDAGEPLERVMGISGSGQQHGTVYLNERFLDPAAWRPAPDLPSMVRPMLSRPTSPIWMDSSTSEECREITAAVGSAREVQVRTGSPAVERFSGPQIRKFWKESPDAYAATAVIHLVSSFMASILCRRSAPIDCGDGAGMNLMNLQTCDWDPVMLDATAPDLRAKLPPPAPSATVVGELAPYFVERYGFRRDVKVAAWSGDNPNSLIGVGGWRPGIAVVSLGTSDTFFAAMRDPKVDPAGYGHVFGNPAGGFMSLICFKNGALAREAVRDRFGMDWREFEECLLRTPAGNNGNMMLPYFVPEITPLVLKAQPVYVGSDDFKAGRGPDAVVRALIEAQAIRLKIHSEWIEGRPDTLRVTGGASANTAICQVLADVFGARVERLKSGNSAALGAAMRAANAATGLDWETLSRRAARPEPGMDVEPIPEHTRLYETEAIPKYRDLAERFRED